MLLTASARSGWKPSRKGTDNMNINFANRKKNWAMIVGIVTVFLASSQIDPTTLTSWALLKDALVAFAMNPYLIVLFLYNVMAVLSNPDTSNHGFGDDR